MRSLKLSIRRRVAGSLAALMLIGLPFAATPAQACDENLLVLSAVPSEIGPILKQTYVTETVMVAGKPFFVGTLNGHDVVIAITGIGINNATTTVTNAITHFGCFSGLVFSGTSGGLTNIGDVTVPKTWELAGSPGTYAVDASMLAAAHTAASSVHLSKTATAGDPACTGKVDPDAVPVIDVLATPTVILDGKGTTSDPFGGRTLPCFPGGGDVFGCDPCASQAHSATDPVGLVTKSLSFLDPTFFFGYFSSPPSSPPGYDAADMETGAAAKVATESGIPFIAFRSLSDGNGDPLMLPGFPFQYFVYRQLAADNAAAMTLAFLTAY